MTNEVTAAVTSLLQPSLMRELFHLIRLAAARHLLLEEKASRATLHRIDNQNEKSNGLLLHNLPCSGVRPRAVEDSGNAADEDGVEPIAFLPRVEVGCALAQ